MSKRPLPHQIQPPPLPRASTPARPQIASWWFVLGREPLLSTAEIFAVTQSVLPDTNTQYSFDPPFLRITHTTLQQQEPATLIRRLGGTVKIAAEIATDLDESTLIHAMVAHTNLIEGKIHFGISVYERNNEQLAINNSTIEDWAVEIKSRLKEKGRSVRYITSDEAVLNSATVFHNHLDTKGREFLVVQTATGYDLAYTTAVQPLDDLSARDFGRPGRDDVSGMLPPKLAIMMLNLGISDLRFAISDLTILDPFCGSGTVLTEALRLGCSNIIGTDISEKAIADTQKNITWTLDSLNLKSQITNHNFFTSDAAALSTHLPKHSIDTIITEPYMGPPLTGREHPDEIKKTCALLADLYIKAFEQFALVLKPSGAVVFSIPRFFIGEKWHTISDRVIQKIKEFGFSKERLLPESLTPMSYVLYHRPGQWVGREIWKFRFKK